MIGDNVKIQNFVSVYRGVTIEDDVFVGPGVTFTNDLYPRAFIWGDDKIGYTMVKRGASIGAHAIIIGGVTIGEYAMVGAGSVVTKDVVPFGLVYGNPARFVGFVCSCGRKLSRIIREDEEKLVYGCECGKEVETTRLTQEIRVKMEGIAKSLLKPDSYYCSLVKICVILWFAKQIKKLK